MQNSKNLRHLFLTSPYKVTAICDYSIDFHKGTCAYQEVRNFTYVPNGWPLCQLQNAKSNFPKFCKVYAQNQKTSLIHLHIYLVETIALILHSKVFFKKLVWWIYSFFLNSLGIVVRQSPLAYLLIGQSSIGKLLLVDTINQVFFFFVFHIQKTSNTILSA